VFVIRSGNREVRDRLAALPLLLDDGRYVAYGPCGPALRAPAPAPAPHRGAGNRG